MEKKRLAQTAGSPIDGPTNEVRGDCDGMEIVATIDTDEMKDLPEEKPYYVPNRHDRRKAAALARRAKKQA